MKKQSIAVLTVLLGACLCAWSQSLPGYGSSDNTGSSYLSYDYILVDGHPIYLDKTKNNVTPPKLTHRPNPKYTKEAKKAKLQGACWLWLTVGTDGLAHDIKVTKSLGMGLDEEAVAAIKKWKFEPAKINGQPVAVGTKVEVNFKIF